MWRSQWRHCNNQPNFAVQYRAVDPWPIAIGHFIRLCCYWLGCPDVVGLQLRDVITACTVAWLARLSLRSWMSLRACSTNRASLAWWTWMADARGPWRTLIWRKRHLTICITISVGFLKCHFVCSAHENQWLVLVLCPWWISRSILWSLPLNYSLHYSFALTLI